MLRWLKTIISKYVIRDVPNELAPCEFGCRTLECSDSNWERCERRILHSNQLEQD
jgi:hypothetical protein